MNDEADPYYEDIIDQMTIGHEFLLREFNVTPTVGWHIDPFGHQASQAAIFSQMGFNSWFFARIDQQDKDLRLQQSALEMIWHPTQASDIDNDIMSILNYYHYEAPPGYCFDAFCLGDSPIMDDPLLEGYNINTMADNFVYYFRNMSQHFRTPILMHTMGSDFQYSNAHMYFKNMDKLINYVNNNAQKYNINIQYSTPSIYIKAINNVSSAIFPKKFDDFFPYSDCTSCYWGGYFTSRVAIKGFVKEAGRYMQSVRTFISLLAYNNKSQYISNNWANVTTALYVMETALGVLQHHDAVAGTEKQAVAYNYVHMLSNATDTLNAQFFPAVSEFTNKDLQENVSYVTCNWNATAAECPLVYQAIQARQPVLLNIYNPGFNRTIPIKIKVPNANFSIINASNSPVYGEVICGNLTDATDCDLFLNVKM